MGKKIRRASLQVQKKDDCNLEDQISLLPDEILILIVSQLSLKEAAITSVISRRWRYVWAFTTRLHFDASETFFSAKLIKRERRKYVNWVNHVVELHNSPTIEEFRVGFDLERNFKSDIDKWLKFALARRVNRLVLDFSLDPHSTGNCRLSYTFSRCSFVGLKFLKALCLKYVNVSGDVLECLLCACEVLEQLCVRGSNDLVHCKVAGPSLVLKYLEIDYCFNIKSMVISNVNLVALKYLGHEISLLLENVPLLVEFSFGGLVSCYWEDFFIRPPKED